MAETNPLAIFVGGVIALMPQKGVGPVATVNVKFAPNASGDTITLMGGGTWKALGYQMGQQISVLNTTGDNGIYTIANIAGSVLTITVSNTVKPETDSSASVTGTNPAERNVTQSLVPLAGAPIGGLQSSTTYYTLQNTVTASMTFAKDAVAGDTITRNDGGNWVSDGFLAGDSITVTGAAVGNNQTFTILSVTPLALVLTANGRQRDRPQSPSPRTTTPTRSSYRPPRGGRRSRSIPSDCRA